MKVLVTGISGQLGFDVIKELKNRNHEVIGVNREIMDIICGEKVYSVIKDASPDAVIHCAAYTAVDKAENEVDKCREVNAKGTEYIAKVCRDLDIKMMYFSTDYVFDGQGENLWHPDDKTLPLNLYGKTKYEGEKAVIDNLEKFFIIRISWVFGVNGNNFVKTMLRLAKNYKTISVVNDQIGSPTYTYDLAKLVADMIETEKYGIYHATNEGICSWYDFAVEIFKMAKIDVDVVPITSEEFPTVAKRPKNSRMDKSKLDESGFERLPHWKDALERYLKEIN